MPRKYEHTYGRINSIIVAILGPMGLQVDFDLIEGQSCLIQGNVVGKTTGSRREIKDHCENLSFGMRGLATRGDPDGFGLD